MVLLPRFHAVWMPEVNSAPNCTTRVPYQAKNVRKFRKPGNDFFYHLWFWQFFFSTLHLPKMECQHCRSSRFFWFCFCPLVWMSIGATQVCPVKERQEQSLHVVVQNLQKQVAVLMRAMDNVDSRLIFPWKIDVVCNTGSPRIALSIVARTVILTKKKEEWRKEFPSNHFLWNVLDSLGKRGLILFFRAALSTSVSPTGQRVADLGSFIAASGVQRIEVLNTRTERESKQFSL